MTDSNERPEPDAWKYESVAQTKEKEFRHEAISLNRPADKILERLNGEDASAENIEGLWSGETIQAWWRDDFKPVLFGEAEELKERGEEDVAEQILHTVKRFEEVFSGDE